MNGQHVIMFPDPSGRNDWVVARRLWWTRKTYAVSADGRVFKQRRDGRWKEKRQYQNGAGYLETAIDGDERAVHRLVCRAYYGDPPPKHVAAHGDDIPTNNDCNNLGWMTQRANVRQAMMRGRDRFGGRIIGTPRGRRGAIRNRNGDWLN